MADLSDEQLDAIRFEAGARQRGATDTVRAIMRAAIAADRALNAPAPSVGAEGLPLQGGMTNADLLSAWSKKLPGVTPSDRELSAFALGAEVGFARALASRPAAEAEGLPPLPKPSAKGLAWQLYIAEDMRAYAMAALASRPAVDADEALRLFDLYAANLLNGANAQACVTRDAFRALFAARHPAQREGE